MAGFAFRIRMIVVTMALAAALLPVSGPAEAQQKTLRFIPQADLRSLDPIWTTAYITRNFGYMVFDTLFALDAAGNAQPQMLAGYTVEDEGKTWKLTLRDGLLFHDGSKVLARDVVASLRRWAVKDAFGQALMDATDELSAPSDKLVQFRLKRVFPLLPQALAKPTNLMAVVIPERLANTPAGTLLNEMVGSGPYRFLPEERVSGARNVYADIPTPSATVTMSPLAKRAEPALLVSPLSRNSRASFSVAKVSYA